jgi:hypothetical protein
MRITRLTQSISTKLSPSQHDAFKVLATSRGIGISEYARQILLTSLQEPNKHNQVRVMLSLVFEELIAVRSIMANLANEQVSGATLTAERLQAICTRADATKAARAHALLTGKTDNDNKLTAVSGTEEAA